MTEWDDDLRVYASLVRGRPVCDSEVAALIRGIDPETCEVTWSYEEVLDPYGVVGVDRESECSTIGRAYFARAPGSDIWISLYNLPEQVRKAIWAKIDRQ